MATSTFRFRAPIARRIADPLFKKKHGTERHLFLVPVREIPNDMPLDPNARRPNTNKRVYKKVEQSLLNKDGEPGTFHLKNKGLTIVAKSVEQVGDDLYDVKMVDGLHGVLDGGHTYDLITKHKGKPHLPEEQFVQVEVRVGIPEEWIPEMARGLNTSVQVQDMSLDNLAGAFEWIKEYLEKESYYGEIAWSENDPGEYDARDIVSIMYMFNVDLFPNNKDDLPVAAYEKKSLALKAFEEDPESFKRMKPILKDLLLLHDTIAKEARDLWNEGTPGGHGGKLAFMDEKNGKDFYFCFTSEEGPYRLFDGALYPILGAFRWFVELDQKTKKMRWKNGFKAVLKSWRKNAAELLRLTKQTSDQLGRNPNAVGKSRTFWAAMHTRVSRNDLLEQQA
jgi:AIPR protein